MKISFLLLVLPFVAAATDSVDDHHRDNLVVDVLDANDEDDRHRIDAADGPFVLADLDRRTRNQPGYCYGRQDYNCYTNGYPKCCSQTKGNCPLNNKPGCDRYDSRNRNQNRNVGRSYCTYSPNYNCYKRGWPRCCRQNDGADCPSREPDCDYDGEVESSEQDHIIDTMVMKDEDIDVDTGAVVDLEEMVSDSPEDLLEDADGPFVLADLDRRTRNQPGYCYGRQDYNCYRNGYPKCCSQTKGNCPLNNKPGCDSASSRNVGRSYCTYSPDYNCYRSGWPRCCNSNGGANCPSLEPDCDYDDEAESSEQGHFLRG